MDIVRINRNTAYKNRIFNNYDVWQTLNNETI